MAKEKNKIFTELVSQLDKNLKILAECPSKSNIEKVRQSRENLQKQIAESTKSTIFQSRVQWHGERERNSKYFFSLEKYQCNNKVMAKIKKTSKGETTCCQKQIVTEQVKFYQDLYKSDKNVQFNLVNNTNRKLDPEEVLLLEQSISLEELTSALKSMKNIKTPGCDGIPPLKSTKIYGFW